MTVSKSTTPDTPFTFQHDGKTFKFEKSFDLVRSPRWLRANRRRDELDLAFTIIEEIAGDAALEAIDDMDQTEFQKFAEKLNKELSKGL